MSLQKGLIFGHSKRKKEKGFPSQEGNVQLVTKLHQKVLKQIICLNYLNYAKTSLQTINLAPKTILSYEGKKETQLAGHLYDCPMRNK